ncbi:MAG TPA: PEGA domain-containing protein [Steroidobacteraceae bacterium]|nr:PEGA domain-containing protein [Steroidobacteraceae bacterium]
MSAAISVRDPLGERRLTADNALTIGGSGSSIPVPGAAAGETLARIAERNATLFLEAAGRGVRCNGQPIAGSVALATGDVIAVGEARIFLELERDERILRVDHLVANPTSPPSYAPGDAPVATEDIVPAHDIPQVDFRAPEAGAVEAAAAAAPAVPSRRWLWLVGAALAVLVLAGYFLSVVSVIVRVDPPDAGVQFSDTIADYRVADRLYALPGEHEVLARRDGYEPLRRAITLSGGDQPPLVLSLTKQGGELVVLTGDIKGTVIVDGREAGATGVPLKVPPGHHGLVVRAPRHLDSLGGVEIEGAGKRQELKVELTPAWAHLTIESKPAGAVVFFDGQEIGKTPLGYDADAGRHQLKLSDPKFEPWETELLVKHNEPQHVGPVELGLPDGTLTIRSTPAGADVTAAGKYRGRTPVTFELPAGAQQEVVVQTEGYEPATEHLRVVPGEKRGLDIALKPQNVAVSIRGEPADAELWIDGTARGAAVQKLELTPLDHRIEVRKGGFETFVTELKPQAGFDQLIEYRLRTPAQAHSEKFPPSIRSASGYVLNLMPAGTFTIGSPRRDPGRRTNETQREVKLARLFYMGVTEVTNGLFRQFQGEHDSGLVKDRTLDLDKHPVANVTWAEAAGFCNWLSLKDGLPEAYGKNGDNFALKTPVNSGYRLPMEAEWEWAARYENGAATRRFPWGNSPTAPAKAGNFADDSAAKIVEQVMANYRDGFPASAPVGTFGADALGLEDMGGNVSEWVNDSYSLNLDLPASVTDPSGPAANAVHTIRGSSWTTSQLTELRLTFRDFSGNKRIDLGFRVARYAE